jgi:hypothetical protein
MNVMRIRIPRNSEIVNLMQVNEPDLALSEKCESVNTASRMIIHKTMTLNSIGNTTILHVNFFKQYYSVSDPDPHGSALIWLS